MKGDFTRSSFDPHKHFTRVLMQQGRVQLDADWNEQVAILLHYMQTLMADLIGPYAGPPPAHSPHGGPAPGTTGFAIIPTADNRDLLIGPGHYYVDGILCENPERFDEEGDVQDMTYRTQPDYPLSEGEDDLLEPPFLVYLDVWERHMTTVEDSSIREVALGSPDTATRAKVVWQVKTTDGKAEGVNIPPTGPITKFLWNNLVAKWQPVNRGKLKARSKEEAREDIRGCNVSPEARYRGAENQLYRVEIHRPGAAFPPKPAGYEKDNDTSGDGATFKWSRDNGTVVFPIRDLEGSTVILEHLGRDSSLGLQRGDWVEIVDDDYVLQGRAEPLLQVQEVDAFDMRVMLSGAPTSQVGRDSAKHPLLRRWDHGVAKSSSGENKVEVIGGALPIREDTWLTLEDGVQILFQAAPESQQNIYRTSDYWFVPARTITGDVEWPRDNGQPEARSPHGVDHHYAPLWMIWPGFGHTDYRSTFRITIEGGI